MRVRIERIVAERGPAVAAVLLVVGVVALGAGVAGYVSPETTEITDRQDARTFATELDASAVVTGNSTLYDRGTRLDDAPVYLSEATPVVDLAVETRVPADRTVTVDQELRLVYVARRDGETFWRNETVLAADRATVEDGNATAGARLDATEVRERLSSIRTEIGDAGEVSARLALSVTYRSDDAEGTLEGTAPVRFDRTSYRVGSVADERTHSTRATRTVEVPDRNRDRDLSLMGLGAIAVVAGGVTAGLYWRRYRHLDPDDLTLRIHRQRYAEWISRGSAPVDPDADVVAVDTLEDLVDVAIDSEARVIHDPGRGAYVVFHDGVVYRFAPGDGTAVSHGAPGAGPHQDAAERDAGRVDRSDDHGNGSDRADGDDAPAGSDGNEGVAGNDDRDASTGEEGGPAPDPSESPDPADARLDGGVLPSAPGTGHAVPGDPVASTDRVPGDPVASTERGPAGSSGPGGQSPGTTDPGRPPDDAGTHRDAAERTEGLESDGSAVDDDASAGDGSVGDGGPGSDRSRQGESGESAGPGDPEPTGESPADTDGPPEAGETDDRNRTDPRAYDVNELRTIAAGEPSSYERSGDDPSSADDRTGGEDPTARDDHGTGDEDPPASDDHGADDGRSAGGGDPPATDPAPSAGGDPSGGATDVTAVAGDARPDGTADVVEDAEGGRPAESTDSAGIAPADAAEIRTDPAVPWFSEAVAPDGAATDAGAGWGSPADVATPSEPAAVYASDLFAGPDGDADPDGFLAAGDDGATDGWSESGGSLFDDDAPDPTETTPSLGDLANGGGGPGLDLDEESFDLVDPQPDDPDPEIDGIDPGPDDPDPEPADAEIDGQVPGPDDPGSGTDDSGVDWLSGPDLGGTEGSDVEWLSDPDEADHDASASDAEGTATDAGGTGASSGVTESDPGVTATDTTATDTDPGVAETGGTDTDPGVTDDGPGVSRSDATGSGGDEWVSVPDDAGEGLAVEGTPDPDGTDSPWETVPADDPPDGPDWTGVPDDPETGGAHSTARDREAADWNPVTSEEADRDPDADPAGPGITPWMEMSDAGSDAPDGGSDADVRDDEVGIDGTDDRWEAIPASEEESERAEVDARGREDGTTDAGSDGIAWDAVPDDAEDEPGSDPDER